jgi:hypothetical protein
MGLFSKKKWLRLVLAASLTIATMGIFTFIAVEPLRAIDFLEDRPVSGGFFMPIDYTIDCLAEGITITNKGRGYPFSPLRNGHLRILTLVGIKNTGSVLDQFSLTVIEKINHRNIKNTILLKLRI